MSGKVLFCQGKRVESTEGCFRRAVFVSMAAITYVGGILPFACGYIMSISMSVSIRINIADHTHDYL